jgi:hypothetical protein
VGLLWAILEGIQNDGLAVQSIDKQPRALQNPLAVKLLAQRLRQTLLRGYQPEDTFAVAVANLTDEELVARYVDRTEPRASLSGRGPGRPLHLDKLRTALAYRRT